METPSNRRFYCLVARDSASLFFGVQATLGTMAFLSMRATQLALCQALPKALGGDARGSAPVHRPILCVTAVLCVLLCLAWLASP